MFSSNHLLSIVSLFHWLCHDYTVFDLDAGGAEQMICGGDCEGVHGGKREGVNARELIN